MSTLQIPRGKTLVIYDCDPDGLMAAAAVAAGMSKNSDVTFDRAVRYQEPDWEKVNKETDVYIVDFNYNAKITEKLCENAHFVTVIDHHKTAKEELENVGYANLILHIDVDHSACVNAWNFFNGGTNVLVPLLLQYIEDMDLWQWKLSDSDVIAAAVACESTNIKTYQALYDQAVKNPITASAGIASLIINGRAILAYQEKTMDILEKQAVYMKIAGYKVKAVNCADPSLVSFLGNRLAIGERFAATFYMQPNRLWKFSIRSIIGEGLPGVDVSEVAKIYGGGGHNQASGFKVDTLFKIEIIKGARVDR